MNRGACPGEKKKVKKVIFFLHVFEVRGGYNGGWSIIEAHSAWRSVLVVRNKEILFLGRCQCPCQTLREIGSESVLYAFRTSTNHLVESSFANGGQTSVWVTLKSRVSIGLLYLISEPTFSERRKNFIKVCLFLLGQLISPA